MKLKRHGKRGTSLLPRVILSCLSVSVVTSIGAQDQPGKSWLAGDHHVHSQYSVIANRSFNPPLLPLGTDGINPIPLNAQMASEYGLSWMVTTDHGARYHAKLNLEQAYPELLQARAAFPDLVQFFGFEINSPGADHASVIVPRTSDEAERVYQLESGFDRVGASRDDKVANTTARMIEALTEMQSFDQLPVVIANHPSRRALHGAKFGLSSPSVLRSWNDAAPDIAIGMVGSPGRQAATIDPDGLPVADRFRSNYTGQPTFGGFDILTAELGGFWDSMLGEGRHWWVTANSDSHSNWRVGGLDFWPGEFSKTWVYAERNHEDILASLRNGKMFVATGDLVSELDVTVTSAAGETAGIGGTLNASAGETASVTIRLRDPSGENNHGDKPVVRRVDLIVGDISLVRDDADRASNPSTRVLRRFGELDWSREGEVLTMTQQLPVHGNFYIRVRGTNSDEDEPLPDTRGENPWGSLWFYSNPVFVHTQLNNH
jgi:hypothetical protein